MLKLLFFVFGAAGGSFLGAVVFRWEKALSEKRINWKKVFGLQQWRYSLCDSCRRRLAWWENIPLVSFVFLKGKCRTCRSPIPSWYFFIELATAIVFLLTYCFWLNQGLGKFFLVIYLLISLLLIFVFVFDLRNQLILNQAVLALLFLSFFLLIFGSGFSLSLLIAHLASGLGGALFLYLLYWLTKGRGMGLGDVKFAFFIGFFLGWPGTGIAFYLAFLTGGLWGGIMVLLKKAKLKEKVPFGPFLVWGTFLAWWWGEAIYSWLSQWLI